MKTAVIIFLILAIFQISVAQNWNWISPTFTGQSLNAVTFLDSLHGWAVGDFGTILRTTDGGSTWSRQNCPNSWLTIYPGHLRQVSFTNLNHGWASGDSGMLIRTTNGGANWTAIYTFFGDLTRTNINRLQFVDDSTGWIIADDNLQQSTDGGITWNEVVSHYGQDPIKFFNRNLGWSWEPGFDTSHFRKTTNGGRTWVNLSSAVHRNILDFIAPDTNNIWGIFENAVYHSSDGGRNWSLRYQQQTNRGRDSYFIYSDFLNQQALLAVCDGSLIVTSDGGTTWRVVVDNFSQGYNPPGSIAFTSLNQGWCVGTCGYIAHSTNVGLTWTELNPRIPIRGYSRYIDRNHGYSSNDGKLWTTNDAGRSWSNPDSSNIDSLVVYGFIECDTNQFWKFGRTNGNGLHYGIAQYSSDGGRHWSIRCSDQSTNNFYYGTFTDPNHGWLFKSDSLLRTTDGGVHWTAHLLVPYSSPSMISFVDSLHGWVFLRALRRTTDGGVTWNRQTIDTTVTIQKICFFDSLTGWASGVISDTITQYPNSLSLFHTTDGGYHWNRQFRISVFLGRPGWTLSNLTFTSRMDGWMIEQWLNSSSMNYENILMHTSDGGTTWSYQPLMTGLSNSISFSDVAHGWISGPNGFLLRTTNGGVTWVDPTETERKLVPEKFTLFPCYPNPFNSSTTISYSLPQSGNIDLKVFDLQGREVTTLSQGFQRAGNYKLNFDARNISSGTYFVRMKAGNQNQVRKLQLIK